MTILWAGWKGIGRAVKKGTTKLSMASNTISSSETQNKVTKEILSDKKAFRAFIQSQARKNGNSVAVGDYSRDGSTEYSYPKRFSVNNHDYEWSIGSRGVKGKFMTTTRELWLGEIDKNGKTVNSVRIATGTNPVNKTNLRKVVESVREQELERL
jgi:hypothetical protein